MIYCTAASEDDISHILEIEREAFSPPWTHGSLLGELYRDDTFFAVARTDDVQHKNTVLGFVILRRTGDDCELLQIAACISSRRRGVADSLMSAMLGFTQGSAISSIFLEVRRGNVAAVALYRKHGFVNVRVRKDYYSDPVEDALVMARGVIAGEAPYL